MVEEEYLGCCCPMRRLRALGDQLSTKVVQKINDTQELVMVNDFAKETNENQFKRCLQDRMADIASWRWVLEDLTKRLEESKTSLKYELKAIKVVIKRVREEVEEHSKMASKPGVLCPNTDCVEVAITEEYDFLKDQRKVFEELCAVIEKQIAHLDRTINKIKDDILNKEETLDIEQGIARLDVNSLDSADIKKKKKKKTVTLACWENKCLELKREGLEALNKALLTKQQVRGARVQLTIAAQALANRVDSAIRRRLHANQSKLQELEWQKEEATKDLQALEEEQLNTEQSLLANLEQERVVAARLADRSHRPNGELTRDEVDIKLRTELARVRRFVAELRSNLDEIIALEVYLKETVSKITCYSDDLIEIIKVDEDRTQARLGEQTADTYINPAAFLSSTTHQRSSETEPTLHTIKEENEDDAIGDEEKDDYPFDE